MSRELPPIVRSALAQARLAIANAERRAKSRKPHRKDG